MAILSCVCWVIDRTNYDATPTYCSTIILLLVATWMCILLKMKRILAVALAPVLAHGLAVAVLTGSSIPRAIRHHVTGPGMVSRPDYCLVSFRDPPKSEGPGSGNETNLFSIVWPGFGTRAGRAHKRRVASLCCCVHFSQADRYECSRVH